VKNVCFADESYVPETGTLCVAVVCFEASGPSLKAGDKAFGCIVKSYGWKVRDELKAREFCKSKKFDGIMKIINCLNEARYVIICDRVQKLNSDIKEHFLIKCIEGISSEFGLKRLVLVADAGLISDAKSVRNKVAQLKVKDSKKVKGIQIADLLAGCKARGKWEV